MEIRNDLSKRYTIQTIQVSKEWALAGRNNGHGEEGRSGRPEAIRGVGATPPRSIH